VVTPEQYLEGKAELGRRVIILDEEGFVTSVGLAEMLADEGKEVELMTRWHHVGVALVNTSQMHLAYPRLLAKRVVMTPNHYIKSIDGKKVTVFNIFTNEEYIREVDGVIMITAKLPNSALYGEMKRAAREVYLVGDSASARGMGEAIYEGHELGRRL